MPKKANNKKVTPPKAAVLMVVVVAALVGVVVVVQAGAMSIVGTGSSYPPERYCGHGTSSRNSKGWYKVANSQTQKKGGYDNGGVHSHRYDWKDKGGKKIGESTDRCNHYSNLKP